MPVTVRAYAKKVEEHPEWLYCPRCGSHSLGKIEECSRDAYEVKSSYSCTNMECEDIVYLCTPAAKKKGRK